MLNTLITLGKIITTGVNIGFGVTKLICNTIKRIKHVGNKLTTKRLKSMRKHIRNTVALAHTSCYSMNKDFICPKRLENKISTECKDIKKSYLFNHS